MQEVQAGTQSRQGGYFRFDVVFNGEKPELDDISKMPELKALASEPTHAKSLTRLANCLVANLFVFELDSGKTIRKRNGKYLCTGYILCRYGSKNPTLELLLDRLTKSSARFQLQGEILPGTIRGRSIKGKDGNFQKRVCFSVTSMEEMVSLRLREEGSEAFDISGSPFSIDWLARAQGLGLSFYPPETLTKKRKGTFDNEGPQKRLRSWGKLGGVGGILRSQFRLL
jgi:hypothetical protein